MRTQKQIVLDLLIVRGETGVSAREAIYDLHITRLAAIIFDLKQDGYRILAPKPKKGETSRYFLLDPRTKSEMPACATVGCGHRYRSHAGRCMAMLNPDDATATAIYCECETYTEAKGSST